MGALEKLQRRVKEGHINKIPRILTNVVKKPKSLSEWRRVLKRITEAFYKRFWFYHPVKCAPGVFARRPRMIGTKEVYTCPGGTTQQFRRFMRPRNFFKYRYGRGGEIAQGLFAVLKHMGIRCRLVIGYWQGADALWVEAWNPYTKRWVSLDPAQKHGYGHKFTRYFITGVKALETETSKPVNRTRYYFKPSS